MLAVVDWGKWGVRLLRCYACRLFKVRVVTTFQAKEREREGGGDRGKREKKKRKQNKKTNTKRIVGGGGLVQGVTHRQAGSVDGCVFSCW